MRPLNVLALAVFVATLATSGERAGAAPPSTAAPSPSTSKGELRVRFFAAGHGDAILLRTPGQTILIDAGRGRAEQLGDNLVQRRILPFLRQAGIGKLDAFFITHPHWDHTGDPPRLARGVRIARIYTNDDGAAWLPGLASLAPTEVLYRGQKLRFGRLALELLNPPRKRPSARRRGIVDDNNRSLVLMVRFGQRRFLLAGDLMRAGERVVLRYRRGRGALRADVLKLGHHGWASTTAAWLRAVRPRYAVATLGDRWGHKRDYLQPKVVRLLARHKARLLRTDRDGDIVFTTDGQSLKVERFPKLRYVPTWMQRKGR